MIAEGGIPCLEGHKDITTYQIGSAAYFYKSSFIQIEPCSFLHMFLYASLMLSKQSRIMTDTIWSIAPEEFITFQKEYTDLC